MKRNFKKGAVSISPCYVISENIPDIQKRHVRKRPFKIFRKGGTLFILKNVKNKEIDSKMNH